MRGAGGLNDLPAREIISGIDPWDIIVGVENPWADTAGGSDQERYNRMAQPWGRAAYTLVGGDWVKVGGRPNAVDGDQLERQFSTWRQSGGMITASSAWCNQRPSLIGPAPSFAVYVVADGRL